MKLVVYNKVSSRLLWGNKLIYTKNLDDEIINRHKKNDADQLLFLAGYLGPYPVQKLSTSLSASKIKCDIIYGCFKSANVTNAYHKVYKNITLKTTTNVFYKNTYNHSKLYMWIKNKKPIEAIGGSANFSSNGLYKDESETLFDIPNLEFPKLHLLLKNALKDSLICTKVTLPPLTPTALKMTSSTHRFTVLSTSPPQGKIFLGDKLNHVHDRGALNWGHGKAHVGKDCAYIPVLSTMIEQLPNLFPQNGINSHAGKGQGFRSSTHIAEALFDDGILMQLSFEGIQTVNGEKCIKQITSYPEKNILGRYIRKRLGLNPYDKIEYEHLKNYGRDDITITRVGAGLYEFDFSV